MSIINTAGKLLKLKILGFADKELKKPRGVFSAYFNPESYNVARSVEYCHSTPVGDIDSEAKYLKVPPKTYGFELLLDGTGASGLKIPVPVMVELFNQTCYNYLGESHRPPYLLLIWGTMIAKCVLTSSSISYDLFNPLGIPLRAKITCSFKSFEVPLIKIAKKKNQSPDVTHLRIIKEGDTLPNLCQEIYGSQSYYLKVAKVNGLVNYRKLVPGAELFFPPLSNTN